MFACSCELHWMTTRCNEIRAHVCYCWGKQLSNFWKGYLDSLNHSDSEIWIYLIQLVFLENQMRSDRLLTYLDRFAVKNCADSAKYHPDWSSSVGFWFVTPLADIFRYSRVFEAVVTEIDLFVLSMLKLAWRASRAANLLKIDLCAQFRLKLAWRASTKKLPLCSIVMVSSYH